MDNPSEKDKQLIELAHNINEIVVLHIKNCSDKDSWIYYYVKTFKVKLPVFSFDENLKEFTKKLQRVFDFAQLSFWTVKVTRENFYKPEDHRWYTDLEDKIFSSLSKINENQFDETIRPFLKINKFGKN